MNPAQFTARAATPPTAARRDNLPPAEPEGPAKRTFEQMLSVRDRRTAGSSDEGQPEGEVAPDAAQWGLLPPPVRMPSEDRTPDDETQPEQGPLAVHGAAPAAHRPDTNEITPPPAAPAPAAAAQAGLYNHLALPHMPAADRSRFEVLDGSMVSAVAIDTQANGGMTVTVATPSQHAVLLERHLPQLHRRLSEKVSAHVRVEERNRRDR